MKNEVDVEKLIALVLKEADERELSAGYGGHMHDGGAGALRDHVKYFRLGQAGIIPSEWEVYKKQLDPEYQQYLELRKKFGS